jgi:hypothetical protein
MILLNRYQRQAIYAFTEFQRAAERQDLLSVIGCGDDLMEVVREFQKEAYFMAARILCKERPRHQYTTHKSPKR